MDLSRLTDDALSRLVANSISEVMAGTRLAALGYHVGHREPMPEPRRHAILQYVFRSPMPRIRRGLYMERWGEPLSARRRHQVAEMLRWFLGRHAGNPAMSRACAEWRADLVLGETFMPA